MHEPGGNDDGDNGDDQAAIDAEADVVEPFERAIRRRLRKCRPRVLPGAVEQMVEEIDGDIVEQQRGDDLVDPEADLEDAGEQAP